MSDRSQLGDRLLSKRVVVCVGSGGVGKTTTAAAIALHAAALGERVLVCTIDPARRLATSLGLEALGHDPCLVSKETLAAMGETHAKPGELYAMMLDQKRTFDEVVERYTSDPAMRERIFANRIYQQISASLTGSYEYAAMAKLYEIHASGKYDRIVLDTPPTANALDFLDAPAKVADAIDSPAAKWFAGRATKGIKALGVGASFIMHWLARFVGSSLLDDMATFLVEFQATLRGFRERAQEVSALLRTKEVGFVLIAGPDPLVIDEAIFFYERLAQAQIELEGFVINRMRTRAKCLSAKDVATLALGMPCLQGMSRSAIEEASTAMSLACTELDELAARDDLETQRLRSACGEAYAYVAVPLFDEDVHDREGLIRISKYIFKKTA